jgi:hypothetical protein
MMQKERHDANFVSDICITNSVEPYQPLPRHPDNRDCRMTEVSPLRLHLLRAVYALIAVAMGAMTWPTIITHSGDWSFNAGVVKCMLGALTLLGLLGIRYPLKMLPLLFWEIAWKSIWLLAVALPAWITGSVDANMAENIFATGLVVIVYAAIPWRYVIDQFVGGQAERGSIRQ